MPNKYSLVRNEKNPERMLHKTNKILKPFYQKESLGSKLPEELEILMQNLARSLVFCFILAASKNGKKIVRRN